MLTREGGDGRDGGQGYIVHSCLGKLNGILCYIRLGNQSTIPHNGRVGWCPPCGRRSHAQASLAKEIFFFFLVPNTYHVHSSVAFLYLFKMILFLSLSPENSDLYLPYFADLICCEDFDSNSFCFVLKMHFSLLQLFVWFDVLSVTVFVIRDRFVKKLTCA